jgi:hypothetical protein
METEFDMLKCNVKSFRYPNAVSLIIEDPYTRPHRGDTLDTGSMRDGNRLILYANGKRYLTAWDIRNSDVTPILRHVFPVGVELAALRSEYMISEQQKAERIRIINDSQKHIAESKKALELRVANVVEPALERFFIDVSRGLSGSVGHVIKREVLDMVVSCVRNKINVADLSSSFVRNGIRFDSMFSSSVYDSLCNMDSLLDIHLDNTL